MLCGSIIAPGMRPIGFRVEGSRSKHQGFHEGIQAQNCSILEETSLAIAAPWIVSEEGVYDSRNVAQV